MPEAIHSTSFKYEIPGRPLIKPSQKIFSDKTNVSWKKKEAGREGKKAKKRMETDKKLIKFNAKK